MKRFVILFALAAAACGPRTAADMEVAGWEERARSVTITRDDWGIPHIQGPTDADAVFGLMYAQAEDDFNRIEVNFLNSQGRLAEAEGEAEIYRDLRMKLFIDPAEMQEMYEASPEWLKDLMDAWADGLNYFLHTHPEVEPKVLTRFEPWMALTFSEGSIGGDIERVNLRELEAFYGSGERRTAAVMRGAEVEPVRVAARGAGVPAASLVEEDFDIEPRGSNGIAIAPGNTVDGNALLLINPHTTFFFRHEAHVRSEEGLNAYGALTWGQFFVYQGFNETAGWMHTSSSVDNIDEFLETVVERDGELFYVYGDEERPVQVKDVTVHYKTDSGMAERTFTVYRTHHGPVVREADGKWVSMALMEEPMDALIQSYSRTKAKNLEEYLDVMESHTNSSNNTLFADAEGNIAYLHSNFVPVRDDRFDYGRPVDGSDPASDWRGVHSIEESPNSINPANGWAYNTNNWPYSASGANSPRREDYPRYMDAGSENARGVHAMRVLDGRTDFTLEGLRDAAFDSYLPVFDGVVQALVRDYDALPASDPRKAGLKDPVDAMRGWDFRWGVESVPTALAVFWADDLVRRSGDARDAAGVGMDAWGGELAGTAGRPFRLAGFAAAAARLEEDFGSWNTAWGEINRFQRLTGDIDQPFDDDAPSTPVGFASGRLGSLASFGARPYPGTKRWYGTSGNSFVAVVEFGERVRAIAVTAGGLHHDPASPHFNDQGERYAAGDLRPVYFHPDE
ncbi:MAG: penicillin acylase family protein, partial [Gemmatimonadota bacterium]|nr:penicillin acylase family protein [Gemmatimonadota bacterium]